MSRSRYALAILVSSLLAVAGEAAAPPWAGRDRYGDPLPPGALARCGTVRLRSVGGPFALSPDGKTVATGGDQIRLWDAKTGVELRTFSVAEDTFAAQLRFIDGHHLLVVGSLEHGFGVPVARPFPNVEVISLETGQRRTLTKDWVQSAEVVANGKRLVTWGPLRTGVAISNLRDGKELLRLPDASVVASSPDGQRLAIGTENAEVELWSVSTGKREAILDADVARLHRLFHLGVQVASLAFSPDGKTVAAGFRVVRFGRNTGSGPPARPDPFPLESPVRVYDVATRKLLCSWSETDVDRLDLSFSPDGRLLQCRTADHRLRLRDVKTWRVFHRVELERRAITATAFPPDGRSFAWAANDGHVRIMNLDSRHVRLRLPASPSVRELTFSSDGRMLWLNGDDLRAFDVETGREFHAREAHGLEVEEVAFTPTGQVVSLDASGELRLWNRFNGAALPLPEGKVATVSWCAAADGKYLAALGADGVVRVWELPARRLACSFRAAKRRSMKDRPWRRGRASDEDVGIAFDPVGKRLAAAEAGTLRGWDLATGRIVLRLEAAVTHQSRLVFSPDGRSLAAHAGPRLRVWSVPAGKSLADEACLSLPSWSFSRAGDRLAFQSDKDTARVLDLRGRPLADEWKDGVRLGLPSFLGDGEVMLADTELVHVRRAKTLRTVPNTEGTEGYGSCQGAGWTLLCVWPDPRQSRVHILEPYSGRLLDKEHSWAENPLTLSADERVLAISNDNEVTFRETLTGAQIGRLRTGHRGRITALTFSPDGEVLATGGADTTVLLWHWRFSCGVKDARETVDLHTCWERLADADARVAWRAMGELVRRGDVAFLSRKLRAVGDAEANEFRRLLVALDDEDFGIRNRARQKLSGLGAEILPWVYDALAEGPSLEVKRSLDRWLTDPRSQHFTPQMRRRLRAVWVLERVGSPEARRALRRLEGVAAADLTREARAASRRLASTGK